MLSCIIGIGLYFYQAQQLVALNTQKIPAFNKHNQQQALLISYERLINHVISSKNGAEYEKHYKKLDDNLKQLSGLSRKNRYLLEQLSRQLQEQRENVTRLAKNERGNAQLKESVLIQLTLITDGLSTLISSQLKQQEKLYQQINSDRLTGRVAAERAKALSNLAISLNHNRELHRLLVDSLVMFSRLDLQYDLIEFDYLQQSANAKIKQWLLSANEASSKSLVEKSLAAQIVVLNDLLFAEQNTFAKWRGQLRRVNEFRTELIAQKLALAPLLSKRLMIADNKPSKLNQQLDKWLAHINIIITEKDYIWFIVIVFSCLALLFYIVVASARTKLKRIGVQSTTAITEYVEKGQLTTELPTQEMTKIFAYIEQLSRPKHSEVDYVNLESKLQSHIVSMSLHSGHAFWQSLPTPLFNSQSLTELLGFDLKENHWRHLFSHINFKAIIAAARTAQKQKSIQRLSLITAQNKAISLSIEYSDNLWCGSVCLTEELQKLQSENSQLQQKMQQQTQAEQLNTIAQSEHVARTVQAVIAQRQLLSTEGKNGEQVDCIASLKRLLNWCEQQKNSAQLRRDDYLLTLSIVNVNDEIHTAVANIALREIENNNNLYVHIDKNINSLVVLESELFQAMVSAICSVLLIKQQQATLDVSFKLIDVSSEQQIVRCSFLVSGASCQDKLVKTINNLTQKTQLSADNKSHSFDYIRDLMLVFNINNTVGLVLEQANEFAFDISWVIAEKKNEIEQTGTTVTYNNNVNTDVKLAKCNILIIATEKSNRQRIQQAFEHTKANIETMRDLLLFQRQLSIKHLTKNSLDAIIMSPEVYCSDYDLITQHLATLPEKVQPKLLVVQPFYSPNIARTGMFSLCVSPWYENELVSNLARLLESRNKNNLLVDSKLAVQQNFLPTRVEVLLAVSQPSAHQFLIQLLHWLGLRVTLVSQQKHLEQHWKTGLYRVAITAFFPFSLEIFNAVTCPRGIFCLTNSEKDTENFLASLSLDDTWQKGYLSTTTDVETISTLLSQWLRPAVKACELQSKVVKIKQNEINANVLAKPTNNIANAQVNDINDAETNPDEPLELVLAGVVKHTEIKALFDLDKFASNQGSAELAAIMIDEYLMDIQQQQLALEKQISENNMSLAQRYLQHIMHIATVLAAEPLMAQCRACNEILANGNNATKADSGLSLQVKEHLQQQVMQLKFCVVQLSEFAESI